MRNEYKMHPPSYPSSSRRSFFNRSLLLALTMLVGTVPLHAQPAWVPSGLTSTMVYAIAGDSQGVLLAAAQTGIFRSTDNGRTWLATGSTTPAHSISINTAGIGFASYFDSRVGGDALTRSSDHGATWTPQMPLARSARDVKFDADGMPIAIRGDSVFRSSDGGVTWEPLGREGFTSSFFDIHQLVAAPNGDLLLGNWGITGGLVFISVDGGSSWQQIYNAGADMSVLDVTPAGTLFLATHDRFVRSVDGGESWTPVPGIATPASQMSIHGNEIDIASDAIYRSTDEGATWSLIAPLPPLPANGRVTGLTMRSGGELVAATTSGIQRLSASSAIREGEESGGDLTIHPNPVLSEATIELPAPVRSRCRVELVDMQGRSMTSVATIIEPGMRRIGWRSDGLAEGRYIIRIDLDGVILSRMVVIAR